MRAALRTLLGVVAGIALAFALVVGVEWGSSILHPLPPDFDGNIAEHVRRYPHWILAVAAMAWAVTIWAAVWVASRIAGRLAGVIVALVLASMLVLNLSMLPYTMWFKVVMPIAAAIAGMAGVRYGVRSPSRG